MQRKALLPILVLTLAACGGGNGTSGPPATDLVGNTGGAPANPAISPDGKRLAWSQPVNGQAAIHVANADGSDPVVLSHGSWDRNPVWSPDGRWIAYLAEGPDYDLMVVPSAGGEPKQLTSEPGAETPGGWLADGSGVVYYRQGGGDVQTLVAPLDGGPAHPIVPAHGGNQYVAISPDGSKAAFDLTRGSQQTIWVQDLPGGEVRQLTTEGFETILPTANAWSPDSRHVAFESRRTGTWDIWTADVETGELKQLTQDVHNDLSHAWSPDGRWIAFRSDRGGQWDVWIIPSAGGRAVRVTNDLAIEQNVQWSPDGRTVLFARNQVEGGLGVAPVDGGKTRMLVDWPGYVVASNSLTGSATDDAAVSPDGVTVLYTSNRSGNDDVWSVPFAGGEPKPFAASPLNDLQPRYSRDGSQVLFTSNRSGSYDLWIMPAAGGEARRLTDWPSDEYLGRWSPDGTQIAFLSNHENTQEDVWLVPSAGGTAQRLTGFGADIAGDARWSPDGRSVYVLVTERGGEHSLYRVPVSGGRLQSVPINPDASSFGEVSPDGAQYAYSAYKDGWAFVELAPTAGAGSIRRLTRRTERVFQVASIWSPDGARLAVADWGYGDDPTTNVLELGVNDTTRRQLTDIPRSFEIPIAYSADGRAVVFGMAGVESNIVSVSVADLLASAKQGP